MSRRWTRATVHRFAMSDPSDASGLVEALGRGELRAEDVVAVIGKTEGNGGANDFTRALATWAVAEELGRWLGCSRAEVVEQVALVWSGGCEGVLSPHMTVFCQRELPEEAGQPVAESAEGRLVVAVERTRRILPWELGRMPEIEEVADAVRRACQRVGVQPGDVHYVQVKGPLLTPSAIAEADSRGRPVVTRDPNLSKAYARGATALGVALGLGELGSDEVEDGMVTVDLDRFSSVASTSAGGELEACEVVLLANSRWASGRFRTGHGRLRHPVDVLGIREALCAAGLAVQEDPDPDQQGRIAAVLAKAEVPLGGRLFGQRTTMLSDADIHAERHARAALGAVIASQTGDPRIFVSGGTEHQAPPGQAPIAAVVDVGER